MGSYKEHNKKILYDILMLVALIHLSYFLLVYLDFDMILPPREVLKLATKQSINNQKNVTWNAAWSKNLVYILFMIFYEMS